MKKYITLLLLVCSAAFAAEKETTLQFKGPEGAVVWHENKRLGKVPLKIALAPRKAHVFKFTAPGCMPQWKVVNLKGPGNHSYTLKLSPVAANVMIQSEPAGAALYIDGKKEGNTPLILQNVPVGKYSGELHMPGFAVQPLEWEVLDERPIRKMEKLVSNNGKLEITSKPAGAKLWINGKDEGYTPRNLELAEGSYVIRLEKTNYVVQENTVIVQRNQTTRKNLALQIIPASLTVSSDPPGAEVFLQGKKHGTTPIVIHDLQPGKHELTVQKEGFDPEKKLIELVSGSNEEQKFKLASYFGSAELYIEPAGVTVSLDGKLIGMVEPDYNAIGTKPIRLQNLRCGTHKLQLSHPHAVPGTVTEDIKIEREKMTLGKYQLWVPNCEITYLNRNEKVVGILISETGDEILFSPEAGVRYTIFKKDVRIRLLKNH